MSPKVMTTVDKVRLEKKRKREADDKSVHSKESKRAGEDPAKPRSGNPISSPQPSPGAAAAAAAPHPPRSLASAHAGTSIGKKRTHPSPFRIKVGCVVALRYRSKLVPEIRLVPDEGVVSSGSAAARTLNWESLLPVWTSPVSGRDEGLALLGKRVRCHLPQVLAQQTRRVLEGEVARLPDYDPFNPKKVGPGRPTKVELLVDESQLVHFPFLKRLAEVDPAALTTASARRHHRLEERIRGPNTALVVLKLASPVSMAASSVTHGAKEVEGGPGSTDFAAVGHTGVTWAILRLVSSNLFWQSNTAKRGTKSGTKQRPSSSNETKAGVSVAMGEVAIVKGQIGREHPSAGAMGGINVPAIVTPVGEAEAATPAASTKVPPAPSASLNEGTSEKAAPPKAAATAKAGPKRKKPQASSASRHVGNGNDPPEQQIQNWRWLACRYHDLRLASTSSLSTTRLDESWEDMLSGGFIGEVIKVDPSCDRSTLARVTLRRLVLPEHTAWGRLPHHGLLDVFEDCDTTPSRMRWSVEVPIEHLVIARRNLGRRLTSFDESKDSLSPVAPSLDCMQISYSYSLRDNSHRPLLEERTKSESTSFEGCTCHRCRRVLRSVELLQCASMHCPVSGPCATSATVWCKTCCRLLDAVAMRRRDYDKAQHTDLPCCLGRCDCRSCSSFVGSEMYEDLALAVSEASNAVSSATERSETTTLFARTVSAVLLLKDPFAFGLPLEFLDLDNVPKPQAQPITRVKSRAPKRSGKATVSPGIKSVQTGKEKASFKKGERKSPVPEALAIQPDQEAPAEDYSVFVPSSARHKSVSEFQQRSDIAVTTYWDTPRNLRLAMSHKKNEVEKVNKVSSRATRADQRRLMKDVAAIGTTWLGVDSLSSREPQLRFDRSGIHAWGVYADEDISAEEMIIEYRGELIENAMAEKREKEYTVAKIGSDYMFRIDANLVCDATKQGNVARFINASCDPNCYTKIITLDGSKRIVIYAKRDIRCGEELCYDYKFPLEYEESKRIPCHCGAKDCRGFMNWDKRYVALPAPAQPTEQSPRADEMARANGSNGDRSSSALLPLESVGSAGSSLARPSASALSYSTPAAACESLGKHSSSLS